MAKFQLFHTLLGFFIIAVIFYLALHYCNLSISCGRCSEHFDDILPDDQPHLEHDTKKELDKKKEDHVTKILPDEMLEKEDHETKKEFEKQAVEGYLDSPQSYQCALAKADIGPPYPMSEDLLQQEYFEDSMVNSPGKIMNVEKEFTQCLQKCQVGYHPAGNLTADQYPSAGAAQLQNKCRTSCASKFL